MRLLTAKSSISNADKLVIEIPTHIEGKKGDKIVKDFFSLLSDFFFFLNHQIQLYLNLAKYSKLKK